MNSENAPLRSALVRDRVIEKLRLQILGGSLGPGDRLNEATIAAQYGISRGPVREACQRLASEGLVEIIERRGAFVVSLSEAELRDTYDIRIVLETLAARLAAQRADPSASARLVAELELVGRHLRAGQAKGYPPDLDFHRSVISLSGNSRLQDAVDHQQKVILLSRARSGALPDRAREAYEEHRAVAKAIAEADADSAAQAMQNHLENAYISARGQLCRASEVCSL